MEYGNSGMLRPVVRWVPPSVVGSHQNFNGSRFQQWMSIGLKVGLIAGHFGSE